MDPWLNVAYNYDPSLEWPGSDVESAYEPRSRSLSANPHRQTCFRLVVKSSAVLAQKKRVAILDAYEEVQIGRDASSSKDIPRIRLKDMEVSKLHATLFWDREREEWAIVDMGSKHGTFVRSVSSRTTSTGGENGALIGDLDAATPDVPFTRLSPERQASKPRALLHSDELSIGRSIFTVHVHSGGLPCDECRSEDGFDIPLFSTSSNASGRGKGATEIAEDGTKASSYNAKDSMTLLKRSLLSRHSDMPSRALADAGASQQYIDRSARRRALHPYSRPDSPTHGRSARPPPSTANVTVNSSGTPVIPSAISSDAGTAYDLSHSREPRTPISDVNVGHRLLEKQGWVPGSALGVPSPRSPIVSDIEDGRVIGERMALLEPLHVPANIGKRGLGMRSDSPNSRENGANVPERKMATFAEWKSASQKRRWEEAVHNTV